MGDFTNLTLIEARDALRQGDFSSRQLTQAYLDRITAIDKGIKAYLTVLSDEVLQAADEADRRLQAGEELPLLGVPLAIKDLLTIEGVRTTCASRILENFDPAYTATAVQRLLDAGAIVLGKTNMDEFAMGSSTENSAYQTTHNPWDVERVPGGTSGGSAAAVAARLAPAALGTDTGGSVRQPASFCGVTGLKPTYGRISRYGLIAFGSSLDSVGPIGHTAEDVALLFSLMAGHDPRDATSMDKTVPDMQLTETNSIKGLRVGVPKEYFIKGIQPEVESAVRAAIAELEAQGAEIVEVSLPHTQYAVPVYYIIAPAEASANLARFDGVRYGLRVESDDYIDMFKQTRGQGFGPEVKRRIMLGTYALSAGYYDAYYGQAQKVRRLIQDDFIQAFEQVDVIATPVAPTTAFRIGEHSDDPLEMYLQDIFTLPGSLAGVPGLAFPVGFDENNLPIGMQLIGPHFGEAKLFEAAHVYQQATDWHQQQPQLNISK
ncbi:MAG: Asp-tRNA(Asn)/Glu-tRNA(Gln) amidotransferase subunit GatA [Chloroflexi bacterium]|nr:MAG: Asp-tRNA(Asn)/Glu-tRNA(Gln) amidotransferase subunit GatA [Chloroflexota bacterium]MBL1192903.1 Asp-tRNA(Asn)/Glu-tRNA(Gln) amidotransferase subunit GatA [Chloroflexota bacterium]NOH10195.1 Asp-tRNA(Asn)/Glu-tRNA(Gln) amidotransferase subunit GatA [Chloroflexota bacterium]